jgi:hypothetical protein
MAGDIVDGPRRHIISTTASETQEMLTYRPGLASLPETPGPRHERKYDKRAVPRSHRAERM